MRTPKPRLTKTDQEQIRARFAAEYPGWPPRIKMTVHQMRDALDRNRESKARCEEIRNL